MNRFERLFHLTRDLLAIVGVDGYLKKVNPAFTALVGHSEMTLLSRPLLEFVHPKDRRDAFGSLEKLAGGTPSLVFEHRWRCRDGSYRWLAWHAVVEGDLFYGVARDVTEQKRSEEAAQHLANLVQDSDDGILGKDLDGRILSWNGGAENLFGYSAEEVLGRHVAMLVAENRRQEQARLLAHVRRGRYVSDLETVRLRKDGTPVHVSLTLSPIHDASGHLVGSSSILRDISERKRAEEAARQANRVKNDFLANISHELRTPLSGIIGTARMLGEIELPQAARELVEIVSSTSDALLRVIDDVLDFSKVEAGELTLETRDFRLLEPLQKVVDLLSLTAQDKGIELVLDVAEGLPKALRGDPSRLRQVLYNLVGNAVKFTQSGRVDLHVEGERLEGEEIVLRFTVSDTGIGIGNQTREKLFTPFVQADTSTSRRYGGTGLGLAISQEIVQRMGGEIEVESIPGEGSTFTFAAAFEPARAAPAARETMQLPPREPRDPTSYRLLLAEDEPVNRMIGQRLIEKLGYRVDVVTNGAEALEALDQESYDLILMDCQMPELDGYETTRRIRRREGDDQGIAVVAVTAHAMKGDREKCLAAGMDDYVTKPYQAEEIAAVLKRWLATPAASAEPSESGAVEEKPVLEASTLESLRRLGRATGRDVGGRVAGLFLAKGADSFLEMRRAVEEGDPEALTRAAHSIYSNAAMLGASSLAALCRDIEKTADGGESLAECEGSIDGAEAEYERVALELRQLFPAVG